MATLGEIDLLTKDYSDSYNKLSNKVQDLELELETVKRKHMRYIKDFANEALEKKSKLTAAIDESKNLFEKPKSIVLHGMKVGLQKGKGKITIPDEEKTILLIKKNLAEQADLLIKTEEKIVKPALENLSAGDLKKVGLNLIESTDYVIIKPTGSDVDKIVNALLKEDTKDEFELVKTAS
ncbi:MAG: hypothetical protein HGGPFJEG_01448 [Ignavibacteria bacterium]|nr:hypothetical protein [Ignavibacteria bacterium]